MHRRPNNFPREGAHNTVTRDAVEHLQSERPKLNTVQEYTIGGSAEAVVHSNDNAEREAAIVSGARALTQSSDHFRDDFKRAEKIRARAAFIRAQQNTDKQSRSRQRQPHKSPSR